MGFLHEDRISPQSNSLSSFPFEIFGLSHLKHLHHLFKLKQMYEYNNSLLNIVFFYLVFICIAISYYDLFMYNSFPYECNW